MKRTSSYHPEHGGAGFYIILAIVLLGALTYAISRDSRSNITSLSKDQSRLAAQEIIDYASTVASAVQKLRLRGCTDTQLSFETPLDSNGATANPNAPGDGSCDVYSANGGKIQHMTDRPSYHGNDEIWYGTWRVSGQDDFLGVGTTAPDLTLNYWAVKQEICQAINDILGYTGPIPVEGDSVFDSFDGTYSALNTFGDHVNGTELVGKTVGCLYQENSTEYDFFQVLIAR